MNALLNNCAFLEKLETFFREFFIFFLLEKYAFTQKFFKLTIHMASWSIHNIALEYINVLQNIRA